MVRCVLWKMGKVYFQNLKNLRMHQTKNNIQIVGMIPDTGAFEKGLAHLHIINKAKCIKKDKLVDLEFDLLIIMSESAFEKGKKEAMSMGVAEAKIASYRILNIPQINFDTYMKIVSDPPSIFANCCWGGLSYHSLGLKFLSPFINMFLSDDDYIKFLHNPKHYLKETLVLKGERYNNNLGINYPICSCDDIDLFFNHYENFDLACECWEKRKKRIKWDNLFVMMYTERRDIAEQFCNLPYPKKICFVPFESENESLCYVDLRQKEELQGLPFWKIVNGMASGIYPYYNVVDLIYYGKVKKLEM